MVPVLRWLVAELGSSLGSVSVIGRACPGYLGTCGPLTHLSESGLRGSTCPL